MTFDQWMEGVDRCCQLDFGLSIHDLPDMCFRDAYDSGLLVPDSPAKRLKQLCAASGLTAKSGVIAGRQVS